MSDRVLQTIIYAVFALLIVLSGFITVLIVKPGSAGQACITSLVGSIMFIIIYVVAINMITRRKV